MIDVYPRLADSDVLVFGTPIYWYGPTALMKAFLDRFVYFNAPHQRERITGHGAVLAIPFEETNPETAAITVAMFEKSFEYLQMPLLGKILAPGVGERGEILSKPDILEKAHQLGQQLATD
jgi:multimeric flavodoxin WrbA